MSGPDGPWMYLSDSLLKVVVAMRRTYQVLGYLFAALVFLQAGAIVWFISGLFRWIEDGAYLDAAILAERGDPHFTEEIGIAVHSLNGTYVIPVVALAMLVVSFFTKDRRATIAAAVLLVLVIVQQYLGFFGPEFPIAGLMHGFNALVLLLVAVFASVRMGRRIRALGGPDMPAPHVSAE